MNWVLGILIAIDQLGNAIAGGNPDSTISARVGYFSQVDHCSYKWYWKTLEWVINFTFYPLDGSNHCLQAFQVDKEEKFKRGSDLARVLLSIIIIVSCFFISIVLRFGVLVIPSWHNKSS
jgi:hypothetical protein